MGTPEAYAIAAGVGMLEFNNQGRDDMPYADIVTALALLQFVWFAALVAQARGKYGVQAPAVTGNEVFERHFRVQQNTLELLIAFIPGLYLFCRYFNPLWGAGLGVVYLLGRQIYAASYVKNPKSRSAGFGLSVLPTLILILAGLAGAVMRLVGH
jgi:glutathione S-transferase